MNNGKKSQETIFSALLRIEKKVDRLSVQNNMDKEYLSTREACLYLSCNRTMLWKLVKEGKVNKQKLENGRTYYSSMELKSLIESPSENNV